MWKVKQRGFGWLDIILYLVLAGIIVGVMAWAENVISDFFTEPVRKELGAEITSLKGQLTAEKNTNALLRAQFSSLDTEVKGCTERTRLLKQEATLAGQRAAAALAQKEQATQAAKVAANKLRALAQGPAIPNACVEAEVILSDLSRDIRAIFGLTGTNVTVEVQ